MSLNQLNFGHAVRVVITSPITGGLLTLTNITDFESKQNTEKVNSKPLNHPPIFAHTPNGWTGTFTFDRKDNTLDVFFADQEDAYWNNAITFSGDIFEYIRELDGTTSLFQYVGVTMTFDDAGKKTSQAKITMKVGFEASRRPRIS